MSKALTDLLAKVEAGEGPLFPKDFPPNFPKKPRAIGAYEGSLDAAKALHEAVLPDAGWGVEWISKYPNLMGSDFPYSASVGWGEQHKGRAETPARAWLIAILKALIAKDQTND